MRQNAVLRAGAGMIAYVQHSIHASINPLNHRKRRAVAGIQPGASIQLLEQNIAAAPVPIGDNHLVRTGLEGSLYGRVDIRRHDLAEAGIFSVLGINLIPVGHAGNAFHIYRDQNFHNSNLPRLE